MPIYEYRCNSCGAKISLFLRSFSQKAEPVCSSCNGSDLTRLVSRAITLKSTSQRVQELDVRRELSGLNPRDQHSIEQWAKRAGKEYDELLGSNFAELADQMDSSKRPSELYDPAGNFALRSKMKKEELMQPKTWRQAITDEIMDYPSSSEGGGE